MSGVWELRVYDSLEVTDKQRIPEHRLSQKQAEAMMQRLACRHLSVEEVIGASVSNHKGVPANNRLADVSIDSISSAISSGQTPHYTLQLLPKAEEE